MIVLAIDAAGAVCTIGVVSGGRVLAEATERPNEDGRSSVAKLAPLADAVLGRAGVVFDTLDLIAVIVGPGGFTGIRAALALAHGMGLAIGKPVLGVTVGEAIGADADLVGRELLVATDSKRGRFFLERAGTIGTFATPPVPNGPVAVAGNAAVPVMAVLAARGTDVMLLDARGPSVLGIATAAVARHEGRLTARDAQPLYVDPPEVRLSAARPRPKPADAAG